MSVAGSEADQNQTKGCPDWISSTEQPDGVLVHGGLGQTKLPGQQDGVLQHVRETDTERPVQRLHTQG